MKLKEDYKELLSLQEKERLAKQYKSFNPTIATRMFNQADKNRLRELLTFFKDNKDFIVNASILISELLSALNKEDNSWFYYVDIKTIDVDYDLTTNTLYDYTISINNSKSSDKIKINRYQLMIPNANLNKMNFDINLLMINEDNSDLNIQNLAKRGYKTLFYGVDLEEILWNVILKNKKINLCKEIVNRQNKIKENERKILEDANKLKELETELVELE